MSEIRESTININCPECKHRFKAKLKELKPGNTIICPQCKYQIRTLEKLSGEEKVKRFLLATKIYDSTDPINIGTKDIELLKDLIAKSYLPLIVGQAWLVLDPDGAEEKKEK